MTKLLFIGLMLVSCFVAAEQKLHGLLDLRYTATDSIDSYLEGGYGKFRFNDGQHFSLAQAALSYQISWQDTLSLQLLANGYANDSHSKLGLTEAYGQYKGLPFANGYRLKVRAGIMYPRISMTNILTAWASPYSLSYSTMDSWVAEELRHQGVDFNVTRLGRLTHSAYDLDLSVRFFKGNDPAGAMLAWHGWIMSSRQSLQQETLALPNSHIGFVPERSDTFLELDDRIGHHLSAQWGWHGHARVLIGYYDNQGDPKVVENVQWAWRTRFAHLGIKWTFANGYEVIGQYLSGDTLMQTRSGARDLVNNDYQNHYLMISKNIAPHLLSARIEAFSVTDHDDIVSDNNNEDGHAVTLSYGYRVNKNLFLHAEYNWLDSERPARINHQQPNELTEKQLQLAVRYLF